MTDPQTDLATLAERFEIHRVSMQFNGGGNLTLIFRVGDHYYEIPSISPAFRPVEPHDSLGPFVTGEPNTAALFDRRETLESQTHGHGWLNRDDTCEHTLIELTLHADQPLTAAAAWERLSQLHHLDEIDEDNRSLYDWKKSFAAAWRRLKSLTQATV